MNRISRSSRLVRWLVFASVLSWAVTVWSGPPTAVVVNVGALMAIPRLTVLATSLRLGEHAGVDPALVQVHSIGDCALAG